ncbi:hypothetical protein SAMN04487948_12124 [Halogranum amylolyticum]|uniref:Uncharacterized protein n=1 Tax=Halogranum amylolyticum TaxID=660520 RepID=A0A1H8VYH6_9EURY|nr:hypothetical protein [Halogranum amylolyticum]SEP20502.1 hypothetical protein SAMN04487948_12124 [Halogranum amylolyticum]
MSGRNVGIVVVSLAVAGVVVGALAVDLGPAAPLVDSVFDETGTDVDASGGDDDGSSTADSEEAESGGSTGGSDDGSAAEAEFRFDVRNIDSCGQTCRDVTVALTNTMNDTATNVEVSTEIYTGGDEIWSASQSFPAVESTETKTRTKRVDLGYLDAAKVKQNGGEIRIETTVTWDGGEQSFTERRKVA